MQVAVENVSELGRRMTVTVEDANIEQAVQERLKALQPTVKMSGFRPGKVPAKMIAQSHGASARRDVIDALVQSSMQEAFTQEKINPASPPHIETMKEEDASLVYSMIYDVFPEVKEINFNRLLCAINRWVCANIHHAINLFVIYYRCYNIHTIFWNKFVVFLNSNISCREP